MIDVFRVLILILAAVAGAGLARACSRRRGWWVVAIAGLGVVGMVGAARRIVWLGFVPPFSWINDGEVNPPLMAGLVLLIFGLLAPRLKQQRQRVVVWVLAGAMATYFGVVPIAAPLAVRASLAQGGQQVDATGVCRQRNGYTCGPAAAVTALRRMGVDASEGSLAIASRCGPAVGADGHALARAMTASAGGAARFRFRWIGDAASLSSLTPAVVSLRTNVLGGHYVAVLEVGEDVITIGDPLAGLQRLGRSDFAADWDGAAIVPDR